MIDLHMHSTFSDGSMTPTELILKARSLDLTAIALTDHDTIEGIPEFIQAGEKYGIKTVPGVEISVDTKLPNHGHMHILGLFIDPFSTSLKNTLDFLRTQRNMRAEKILHKLKELGVTVTLSELLEEAGEGSIGRPHIAKILVRNGIVANIKEAFNIYLAKGGPAYVEKVKLGETDAIHMIKEANGLAILAHPHLMKYDTWEETEQKIMELRKLGLDGFEIYYSAMPEHYTHNLKNLAEAEGFITSGGSDFHGSNKDGIDMGSGVGDLAVPEDIYIQMKNYWQKMLAKVEI